MFKQLLALIAFSTAIVFTVSYAEQGVHYLVVAHDYVSQLLTDVFSGGHAGNLARGLLALLTVPFLVGLTPTVLYWMIKRHWFPYFMEIVWVVWLVQIGALMVLSKSAA